MLPKWVEDIEALLIDSEEQIRSLENLHDEALDNAGARGRFRARIKNVLEHQRSTLDYLAVGLTKKFGTPKKGIIYYPLAQHENEFDSLMESRMPGVAEAEPDIAAAIKRHQPYTSEWLRDLNQLTRQQKHNELSLQIVQQSYECRVTEKTTGAVVSWRGIRFRPGAIDVWENGTLDFRELGDSRPPDAPKPFDLRDDVSAAVFGVPIDPLTQRPHPADHLYVESGVVDEWWFVKPYKPVLVVLRLGLWGCSRLLLEVLQASRL